MRNHSCKHYLASVTIFVSLMLSVAFAQEEVSGLPAGFKLIGKYKTSSKLKVENGKSLPILTSPLVYRAYSDGLDVRIYCEGVDDTHFAVYQIYNSEGVGSTTEKGETDYIAGIQASSSLGDVLRQISLTRNRLVMVKMPTRSHRVIVTNAEAIDR